MKESSHRNPSTPSLPGKSEEMGLFFAPEFKKHFSKGVYNLYLPSEL